MRHYIEEYATQVNMIARPNESDGDGVKTEAGGGLPSIPGMMMQNQGVTDSQNYQLLQHHEGHINSWMENQGRALQEMTALEALAAPRPLEPRL